MGMRKLGPVFGCVVSVYRTAVDVFPGTSDGMFPKSFGLKNKAFWGKKLKEIPRS